MFVQSPGKKVWTVKVDDVEEIICEHYPKAPPNTPKQFSLKPNTYTVTVTLPLSVESKSMTLKIGRVKVTQFAVNSNYATTCHKMQVRCFDVRTFLRRLTISTKRLLS